METSFFQINSTLRFHHHSFPYFQSKSDSWRLFIISIIKYTHTGGWGFWWMEYKEKDNYDEMVQKWAS